MNWKLKQAIEESGFKQKHIAKMINMDGVSFSRKVHDEERHFTREEKERIAKVLGINVGVIEK
jgi:ribosome-binding protein aMBF1 (putative translation factor)